jgi:hypothetical protein
MMPQVTQGDSARVNASFTQKEEAPRTQMTPRVPRRGLGNDMGGSTD